MAGSVMPTPEAADPNFWEKVGTALAALLLGGAVAARKLIKRSDPDAPDYEAMAAAFFAVKERADTQHRDAITDAIHELCTVTRDEHAKTRELLRDVNDATRDSLRGILERFGMDIAVIKDRVK
jgi:hypothetical protein